MMQDPCSLDSNLFSIIFVKCVTVHISPKIQKKIKLTFKLTVDRYVQNSHPHMLLVSLLYELKVDLSIIDYVSRCLQSLPLVKGFLRHFLHVLAHPLGPSLSTSSQKFAFSCMRASQSKKASQQVSENIEHKIT